ncbi:MAG: hypothetical protein ACJAX6_001603 [Limisphaerales bacterium]|jgi:hypothetical protein
MLGRGAVGGKEREERWDSDERRLSGFKKIDPVNPENPRHD